MRYKLLGISITHVRENRRHVPETTLIARKFD